MSWIVYSKGVGRTEMHMTPKKRYVAYMLRLWQSNNNSGSLAWQASLEDPHNGEQIGFADLISLFSYLKDQTGIDGENGKALVDEEL
jgi:hypothetical protein